MVDDWDAEVGRWIDGIPYIWEKSTEWNRCRRLYVVNGMARFVLGENPNISNGYLPNVDKECKKVSGYFEILYFDLGKKYTFHGKDVRINGMRVTFPYRDMDVHMFYDYLGIKQPTYDYIKRWPEHLTSEKLASAGNIVLPTVHSSNESLKRGESFYITTMIWYLKYVGKNPGLCMPISMLPDLPNQGLSSHVFNILIFLSDPNTVKNIYISPDIIHIVELCSKNEKIRYILLPISLQYWRGDAHANLMLIDLKNYNSDKTRNVYLFDPWGEGEFNVVQFLPTLMTKLKFKDPKKWKYHAPVDWCPTRSLQRLEHATVGDTSLHYVGYCQMWTFWFIDVLIRNPNIPITELIRRAQIQLSEKNPDFRKFIREYAKNMERYTDEQKVKLGIKYDTPTKIIPTPARRKLQSHIKTIRDEYIEQIK